MSAMVMDADCTGVELKSSASAEWPFSCDFEVDYRSTENAKIAYASLVVDKELQPDKVKRHMTVVDGKLQVHFEAVEARFLRASFNAFVDLMILTAQIIEEFGQKNDSIEK